MGKDSLFLIEKGFTESKQKYYCPDSARLEGVITYYPSLNYSMDIKRIPFEKPRSEIVDMFGEQYQGCPLLVIRVSSGLRIFGYDDADSISSNPSKIPNKLKGILFSNNMEFIDEYLCSIYGVSKPNP